MDAMVQKVENLSFKICRSSLLIRPKTS